MATIIRPDFWAADSGTPAPDARRATLDLVCAEHRRRFAEGRPTPLYVSLCAVLAKAADQRPDQYRAAGAALTPTLRARTIIYGSRHATILVPWLHGRMLIRFQDGAREAIWTPQEGRRDGDGAGGRALA